MAIVLYTCKYTSKGYLSLFRPMHCGVDDSRVAQDGVGRAPVQDGGPRLSMGLGAMIALMYQVPATALANFVVAVV